MRRKPVSLKKSHHSSRPARHYCILLANIPNDFVEEKGRALREPAKEDKAFVVCPLTFRLH